MRIEVNPKYKEITDFLYTIPSIFLREGDLVYEARNTIKTFAIDGLVVNVKSFKKPILINQFAYKYLRKSKAERSFINAMEIIRRGVLTPDPVAFIEISRNGLITESYYISIHEQVRGTMKEIYKRQEEDCKDLIQAFTLFTAELHKKGIFHKDYSPGNILFKEAESGYKFYLVDLNRMSFKEMNMFDGCRSFSRLRADNDTLDYISEEYSKVRKYDEESCKKLIQFYNHRFWKKHLVRHPESMYDFQQEQLI